MAAPLTMAERLELLEEENLQLREQIADLTRLPPDAAWPEGLRLTAAESAVLEMLVARGFATRATLLIASRRHGSTKDGEDVEPKVVDVFICKLRRKLRPYNVGIRTHWGRGYELLPEDRARLLGDAA